MCFLSGEVFDFAVGILDDGLNTIFEAGLSFVLLALADDLSVSCFEGEVAFAVGGFFELEVVFGSSVLFY